MAKQVAKSGTKSGGGKRIVWFALAVALGVGGYFGWKWWKNKKDENKDKDTGDQGSGTFSQDSSLPSSTPTQSGGGSSTPSSLATNPFTTSADLKKFQEWVINTKKDTTILGSAGADGVWGKNSAKAWEKYGAEYKKSGSTSTTTSSDSSKLDSDTIQILVNTRNNGYRVAWGSKATESYIKSSKYPSFFNAWKDAVKRRMKDGGNTLFTWYNQWYDSYTGNRQWDQKTLRGRNMKATAYTKVYSSPDGTLSSRTAYDGGDLGTVETYRYTFSNDTLWLKSSMGDYWFKSKYVKVI